MFAPHEGAAIVIHQILDQKKKIRQDKITTDSASFRVSPRVEERCHFCGQADHVWAECYNLCGVCGEYGHFKSSCDRVTENRVNILKLG